MNVNKWSRMTPQQRAVALNNARHSTTYHRARWAAFTPTPAVAYADFDGFAHCDEVCRSIRHTGWFADAFQDQTYRGVILKLGARFVAGYVASDGDGDGQVWDRSTVYGDATSAALAADSLAQHGAEEDREENELWHAAKLADERLSECESALQADRTRLVDGLALLWPMRAKPLSRELLRTMVAAVRECTADLDAARGALREFAHVSR